MRCDALLDEFEAVLARVNLLVGDDLVASNVEVSLDLRLLHEQYPIY